MKSQRATFRSRPAHLSRAERHRRSASGAAVRPTRGSALGRGLGCAFATRRVAQFAATPRGGLQLVGARCIHRWRRTALTRRARMKPTEKGSVFATRRVARALTNRKSEWKAGPSPGSKFPIGSGESSPFRLFREATQLKTVGTVIQIAGNDPGHPKNQVHPIRAPDRRRPPVTEVADIVQCPLVPSAIARGGEVKHPDQNPAPRDRLIN